MTVRLKKYLGILLILMIPAAAAADIQVEISALQLDDGLAVLESIVNDQTSEATDEIKRIIKSYTVKPLLFGAMTNSSAGTSAIIPISSPDGSGCSISLGTSASVLSDSLDPAAIGARFNELGIDAEADFEFGASLQAFTVFGSFPADCLLEGLRITAGLGTLSFNYENYRIGSSEAHLSAALSFFGDLAGGGRAQASGGIIGWNGISLSAGFSLSGNSITGDFKLGTINRSFSIDPDGAGPMVPFDLIVSIKPELSLQYTNSILSLPLAVSSGITIFDFFEITAGLCGSLNIGGNAVGVSSDDELEVQGYLSQLIKAQPRLILSGSQKGADIRLFSAMLFGSFTFKAGDFRLTIPAGWDFGSGLTAALVMGVGFR